MPGYLDLQATIKDMLGELYEEVRFFEISDGEVDLQIDSAMGHLVHVAAEHVGMDDNVVIRIVDLATKIWDEGDDRARNMILVSFFENFDNLEVGHARALHRIMKPHMRKMLEAELEPHGIDWSS